MTSVGAENERRKMKKWIVIIATLGLIALGTMVAAADSPQFFEQCGDATAPYSCIPSTNWTGGDLNSSNSRYTEGVAVPQKILFRGITGTVQTIQFQMSWTRSGKHTYDFPVSWAQAEQAYASVFGGSTFTVLGSECSGMTGPDGTACSQVVSGTGHVVSQVPVPDDPYVSGVFAGLATGSTQAKINSFESYYGNRVVTVYTLVPIVATMTMSHTVANGCDYSGGCGGTGNNNTDSNWSLMLTASSPITEVLVTFAAHVALGNPFGDPNANGVGWGYGTGAATVSGSPYHVNNVCQNNPSCFTGGSGDNQMNIAVAPTAVGLSSFSATPKENGVQLNWRTGTEVDTASFNIYRAKKLVGPYERVNTVPVAAVNSIVGGSYQYIDTTASIGQTYWYELEDIELNGKSTRHDPVAAVPSFSGRETYRTWENIATAGMILFMVGGALTLVYYFHHSRPKVAPQ